MAVFAVFSRMTLMRLCLRSPRRLFYLHFSLMFSLGFICPFPESGENPVYCVLVPNHVEAMAERGQEGKKHGSHEHLLTRGLTVTANSGR